MIMLNLSVYAVEMLDRSGDLEPHGSTVVVKPCVLTNMYQVEMLLNGFHRSPGPDNIQ